MLRLLSLTALLTPSTALACFSMPVHRIVPIGVQGGDLLVVSLQLERGEPRHTDGGDSIWTGTAQMAWHAGSEVQEVKTSRLPNMTLETVEATVAAAIGELTADISVGQLPTPETVHCPLQRISRRHRERAAHARASR